ncbi:MAG: TIGR02301 family protein [Hyphomicrobiaceae bacterium]|nr:TIGR02301 family protein [Hyphomicrobiaceae bacterium]
MQEASPRSSPTAEPDSRAPRAVARAPGASRLAPATRATLVARIAGAIGAAILLALAGAAPALAQAGERKPYDEKLLRLSEILGAVHYLRELCGADDGQLWRNQMRQLITADGTTALRRARLTRSFNQGYRSYSRTYNTCTPSARTAVERFIAEGVELSDELVKSNP